MAPIFLLINLKPDHNSQYSYKPVKSYLNTKMHINSWPKKVGVLYYFYSIARIFNSTSHEKRHKKEAAASR